MVSKPIELTWKTREGRVVVERCLLIEEEDPVYVLGQEEPTAIITDKGVGITASSLMGEMVMFEDDVGLFGVHPENVIFIKEV